VVYGPEASCREMWRAKGNNLRKLWIPEEVGCCLQEGVPSCSSGTVQGNIFRKFWTMEGIGHSWQGDDPLCRSGTTQGTQASEMRKRRYCIENPKGTDIQDEMLEGPRMQNWNKGPRRKTSCVLKSRGHQMGLTGRLSDWSS
jgi:hypothetical protein